MISIFDLFKIGMGPSSSHTVGPMRAALTFITKARDAGYLQKTLKAQIDLYGSLALTGKGHGTDIAVILGFLGEAPDTVDPDQVPATLADIRASKKLRLADTLEIPFIETTDLLFHKTENLPYHPNGMRFSLFDAVGECLFTEVYYSIGGGFIVNDEDVQSQTLSEEVNVPYPFSTASQLLHHCKANHLSISDVMRANELALQRFPDLDTAVLNIWHVMRQCIERGCREFGILPGGLKVKRRAHQIMQKLIEREHSGFNKDEMQWLNVYALAVNEENAANGRVVTAPTNGAAGIIPAVLNYYINFTPNPTDQGIVDFMLTATAIGILFKEGASISAAEMGCQGEVGVACSMAAGALCAVWGGTPEQVENAAEMGIEHNLGLTCDPIGGLVQIPCIERNTMGSVQAVNCAKLALMGDGTHIVSLDDAIKAMKATGIDMQAKYRETAMGGLAIAVSQPEC
jgi:L-serine dehydratase